MMGPTVLVRKWFSNLSKDLEQCQLQEALQAMLRTHISVALWIGQKYLMMETKTTYIWIFQNSSIQYSEIYLVNIFQSTELLRKCLHLVRL